jgi:hypothetical protein
LRRLRRDPGGGVRRPDGPAGRGGAAALHDPRRVFRLNDAWQTTARFLWAPLSAGSFVTTTPLPDVLGNLDLGLQAVTRDNLEIKVEYGLNVGQDFLSQRGMARFAVHF